MKSQIDPSHGTKRSVLRIIGPIVLLTGIGFTAVGFIDFVMAMNSFGPPAKFWCFFVGVPLIFVGVVLSSAGFLGTVHRYMANETAPVAKDTFNYLADGTREGVQTVAKAVGTGIRSGMAGETITQIRCHKCNALNDANAKFCKECGTALSKTKACPCCDELNDPDAKFCDECGKALS